MSASPKFLVVSVKLGRAAELLRTVQTQAHQSSDVERLPNGYQTKRFPLPVFADN